MALWTDTGSARYVADIERNTADSTSDTLGRCHCGCGASTKIIAYTDRSRGWIKGQPYRFLSGHAIRLASYHRRQRVGDTVDRVEIAAYAKEMSLARAAEFLGVHFSTLARIADREGIRFQNRRHYGYGDGRDHAR